MPLPNNALLRALPPIEWTRIAQQVQPTLLYQGQVLHEIDTPVERVYFVNAGLVSLTLTTQNGGEVEVGMAGREGLVGVNAIAGEGRATSRATVQIPGKALAMPADVFREGFMRGGRFQELVLGYLQAMFTQTAQTALCNRMHSVEERLCRWLLVVRDRLGADEFEITQEFIAQMLGVRRSGVTIAAGALRQNGLIDYTRGNIHILKPAEMAECACACYPALRDLVRNLYK
jgi:CRP-like cAMP-binding protein